MAGERKDRTMSNKGTIRIPRPTFDKHNQRRQDLGLTWEEYIDGQAPESPGDELGERLDRVESAVGTVEERTGRIERTLDELGGSR